MAGLNFKILIHINMSEFKPKISNVEQNNGELVFIISGDDDYGFVLLEVEAGNDPQFLLTRVSHGSYEDGLVNNEITDTIRVRANNVNPAMLSGLFPQAGAENDRIFGSWPEAGYIAYKRASSQRS